MLHKTAIFAGVLCIITLLALAIVSFYYNTIIVDKDAQLSTLNSQITSLNSNLSTLTVQANNKDTKIQELSNQISLLTNQNNELNSKLDNLTYYKLNQNVTELWLDDTATTLQSGEATIWNRTILYPGYLTINKIGGGSTKAGGDYYVQVTYSSGPVYYNQKFTLGKSTPEFGGLNFPLLPTSNLELKVGYDNIENSTADIRITASYIH